ncbi:MAG: general secretion pathway protein GspN [Beijerinckiaceae bacterium]|nr:general secretion pathway protein GspN [Beijerinckiaceae bacterium]
MSSAFSQAAANADLWETGTGGASLDAGPSPAGTKQSRAQQLAGGNPLWGVPIYQLTVTRERPLFRASRRPPAPPAAPEPEAPPPPPPSEPERPLLTLVGTVTGAPQNVAVVQDQTAKSLLRLHVGEAVSGWILLSIDARRVAVEKNGETVTMALPASAFEAKKCQPSEAVHLCPAEAGKLTRASTAVGL